MLPKAQLCEAFERCCYHVGLSGITYQRQMAASVLHKALLLNWDALWLSRQRVHIKAFFGLIFNRCDGTKVINIWGSFGGLGLLSSLPFPAYRGKVQFQAILWAFVMQNWWNEDETEWPKAQQMDFWLKSRAKCPLGEAYPLLGASGKRWWTIWWQKSGLTGWCGSINNSSGGGQWEASRGLVHYEIRREDCNKCCCLWTRILFKDAKICT